MLEWKDVIQYVSSTLGSGDQAVAVILKFLHVLPEEVIEGRKINLSVCSIQSMLVQALIGAIHHQETSESVSNIAGFAGRGTQHEGIRAIDRQCRVSTRLVDSICSIYA